MIQRRSWEKVALACTCASLGILLTLVACSSSEPEEAPSGNDGDGGDSGATTPEAAVPADASDDAVDASDAGDIAPPPYDFAVKCAVTPCVTRIAARGGAHACAVLQDGTVRCWGADASGQLGRDAANGIRAGYDGTPRPVVGIANAKDVASTGQGTSGVTCVVHGAGDVACFGSNAWGQIAGADAGSNHPDPVPVTGLQARSVTFTNTFALAIGTDGLLWSWGTNDTRQLARTTTGPDAGSASEAARADSIASAVRSCAGTSKTAFVVSNDGDLLSWGGGATEQLGRQTSLPRDPIPVAIGLAEVSNVATGVAHACALHRGRVDCWGKNDRGQLGTGRKVDELVPRSVVLPAGVHAVAVAAGGNNTCVIDSKGDVYCWGASARGQTGEPSPFDQPIPVKIEGLTDDAVALAIMDTSVCALLRGGSVACWGDNLLGQLGRGTGDLELHAEPAPAVFK